VRDAIAGFGAVLIGPGSFFTSLMPTVMVGGVREAIAGVRGPVILVANLLTEGRGMDRFTAAHAVSWLEEMLGRRVDVVLFNTGRPATEVLERYAAEHKHPLERGTLPATCEVVEGDFWTGDIARHDRRRLSYAAWAVLSRLL
jgi:uncharacterized cofD-like protein